MSRRTFLHHCLRGASAAALAPLSAAAASASAAREFHVLMITFRGETDVDKGFRAYLADAGLKVRYTVRDLAQDVSRMPSIVQEARALAPDLIYVWGTPATLALVGPYDASPAAPQYIHDIPVVFALVAAPLQSRIVQRLDAPGRNVTGAVHVVPPEVQLRVMYNYLPYEKVGVLYNAREPNSQAIVDQARVWCASHRAELVERTFHSNAAGQPVADGVEDLVAQIQRAGAQWLYLLPDTFLGTVYGRVTPAALQLKLPSFGAAELAVRSGGALLGLVSRYWSVGQLAGAKAAQILVEGKAPAQVPVETLKRFSLLVNMRVAHSLHLYPPIDMLNYAEVIAVGDGASPAS